MSNLIDNFLNEIQSNNSNDKFSFKTISKNMNSKTKIINIEFIPENENRISVMIHYMDKDLNQVSPSINCGYLNQDLSKRIMNSTNNNDFKNELSNLIKNKMKEESIKVNKKIIFNIHDRETFSL